MIDLNKQQLIERHYLYDIVDLKKIQRALFIHRNLFVSLDEAALIWQNYSSNLCASWLFVPKELESIPKFIESDELFDGYYKEIE